MNQTADLVDNTWMYIINEESKLFPYSIALIDDVNNHLTNGSITNCPIVSNNPKNTNFYICDGDNRKNNLTTCIECDDVTQTATQSSACTLYFCILL